MGFYIEKPHFEPPSKSGDFFYLSWARASLFGVAKNLRRRRERWRDLIGGASVRFHQIEHGKLIKIVVSFFIRFLTLIISIAPI